MGRAGTCLFPCSASAPRAPLTQHSIVDVAKKTVWFRQAYIDVDAISSLRLVSRVSTLSANSRGLRACNAPLLAHLTLPLVCQSSSGAYYTDKLRGRVTHGTKFDRAFSSSPYELTVARRVCCIPHICVIPA